MLQGWDVLQNLLDQVHGWGSSAMDRMTVIFYLTLPGVVVCIDNAFTGQLSDESADQG